MNEEFTYEEMTEIVENTIRKIECYPAECDKTVENYFDILLTDEIKNFIMRREVNRLGIANMTKRSEYA